MTVTLYFSLNDKYIIGKSSADRGNAAIYRDGRKANVRCDPLAAKTKKRIKAPTTVRSRNPTMPVPRASSALDCILISFVACVFPFFPIPPHYRSSINRRFSFTPICGRSLAINNANLLIPSYPCEMAALRSSRVGKERHKVDANLT